MQTLKTFFKYFVNFIVLFLLVSGLTYLGTKKAEKKTVEYIAQEKSPVIEVSECTNKKISGTATNDTKVLINVIYVQADFYNKENELLGTDYFEIKYFNVGEKSKFEIEYNYKDVSYIKLSATETKV